METKSRAQFIDMLKGYALLIMIEVHVFNELLQPEIRSAAWYSILSFINGLVAPAFTFTSGMVFILSLQKGLDELRKFGMKFWKKLGRLLLVFLAGYALHMPYLSYKKTFNPNYPNMINEFLRVDILQCIAVGLVLLLFLRLLIKSDKPFYITILVINFLILIYGPIAWKTDYTKFLPLALANYLNGMNGSLFPLFPWLAFIFTGALVGKYYVKAKQTIGEKLFAKNILIAGIIFFAVSFLFLFFLFPTELTRIKPNYFFFVQRLGVLLILLGIFWFYINKFENYKSFILDVSRESLLVYWFHIKLLYIKIYNNESIVGFWKGKLNVLESILITIVIAFLMIIFAKAWGWIKQKYPVPVSRIILFGVTLAVIVFFLS